jgi:hypothetical protein
MRQTQNYTGSPRSFKGFPEISFNFMILSPFSCQNPAPKVTSHRLQNEAIHLKNHWEK